MSPSAQSPAPVLAAPVIQQKWALGLMLLTLHSVMVGGFDSPLQKTLLICHYGLFLLWQPVWRGHKNLSVQSTLFFLAGGCLLIYFVNWWLLAFWLTILFGLLGGRVFSSQAKGLRISYLLAASYLLSVLLMWVVPMLLGASADVAAIRFVLLYVMPLLPLGILFIRVEEEESSQLPTLDFFYTLFLLLLAVILVLGSFAIQAHSEASYIEVLLKVVIVLTISLLALSWLWNPRAGFTGIGQLLSGYLLSVGLPFEQWVKKIAVLAELEAAPKTFTQSAIAEIADLPWVRGASWESDDGGGNLGSVTPHHASFHFHDFQLTLYTRWPLTPALLLHIKLLTQIVGEFYEAKRREQTLRQNTYMQAVYETGSRLTHDIKNLVQSMSALCTAAENSEARDDDKLLALLRRQLPQLNRRLALTLDKLQAPRQETGRQMDVSSWWQGLKQRHAQRNIQFLAHRTGEMKINADVVDSVMDNLLHNAIEKSKQEAGLQIQVELWAGPGFSAEVSDSGRAMPPAIAGQLFKKHIRSESGLGIGLYHAARQAEQAGYQLQLLQNQDGAVRFRLSDGVVLGN